jgi:hypothetical protein
MTCRLTLCEREKTSLLRDLHVSDDHGWEAGLTRLWRPYGEQLGTIEPCTDGC